MTLRKKTLLIIILLFVSLIAVFFFVSQIILSNNLTKLEKQETKEDVQRVLSALNTELFNLEISAVDWAEWDDTYAFVQNGNLEYQESNLGLETFSHLNLNLLMAISSSGETVFGKAFNLDTQKEVALPDSLQKYIYTDAPLINHTDTESSISGFILLSEEPMMLVSHPILTSRGEGPIRGTLIMGRFIRQSDIERLGENALVPFSLQPLTNVTLPSDYQKILPSLIQNDNIIVQPISNVTYGGYALIKDVYNRPVIVLQTKTLRDIYQEGQTASLYLILSLVIVGLLFTGATTLLMEKQVLLPLTRLTKKVSNIRFSGDISVRIPVTGHDELSNLGSTINSMLTTLQQSEQNLKESEDKFQDTLEQANDGIIIVQGKSIKYANPHIKKLIGYTEADGKDLTLERYIWPSELTRVMQDYQQHLVGNNTDIPYETILKHENGNPVYVECTPRTAPYHGELADFVYIRDISERNRVKQELETRAQILNAVLDIVFLRDFSGKLLYVNERASEILGYSREKLLTMMIEDLLPPEHHVLVQQQNETLLSRGQVFFETTFITSSSSEIPVEIYARSIKLDNQKLSLAVIRDITRRKETEEALRKSEEKYLALVENSNDGILVVQDNIIKFMNTKMTQWLGYPREELMGKPIITIQPPAHIQTIADALNKRLAGKKIPDWYEVEYLDRDGKTLPAELSVNVIEYEGKQAVMGVVRDTTERKRIEEELRQLYQTQVDLSKNLALEMSKRTEFFRALVHELKTPLTSIIASSDLLVSEMKEDPWISLSNNIYRSATHLNARINELYDLARSETNALQIEVESVDTTSLLHAMSDEMSPVLSSRKQSLRLNLPPDLPFITADKDRLRQIIFNLIDNASKFTPEGGNITLKASEKDQFLIVEIQDTGRGMNKEDQQHLFTPYYRREGTRDRASGLGLGLSICKNLVELHGGKIWVKSQEGKGSTFSFSIPLDKPGTSHAK